MKDLMLRVSELLEDFLPVSPRDAEMIAMNALKHHEGELDDSVLLEEIEIFYNC